MYSTLCELKKKVPPPPNHPYYVLYNMFSVYILDTYYYYKYSTLCELKKKFHPHPTTLRYFIISLTDKGGWVGVGFFFKFTRGGIYIVYFQVKRHGGIGHPKSEDE